MILKKECIYYMLGCYLSFLGAESMSSSAAEMQSNNSSPSLMNPLPPDNKEHVKFDAELLIWSTTEGGLAYGNAVGPSATPHLQLTAGVDTTMQYVNPPFNVGTRVACMIPFNDQTNTWESIFTWTYYYNDQTASIYLPPVEGVTVGRDNTHLTPVFTNMTHIPIAQGASAYWKLVLNVLDMELAKHFYPSSSLSICAHAGVRGAWITQTLKIDYMNVAFNGYTTTYGDILSNNKIHFSGWGLRLGLDNEWDMLYGFKMYVNTSLSILNSFFKNRQNQTSGTGAKETFFSGKFYDTSPILDLLGGFGWGHIWKEQYSLSIYALWEENLWFHQNQLSFFTTQGVPGYDLYFTGDLGFSGPVIGVNFGF